MSWSFQVKSGDLNLSGPDGYAAVQGPQKLVQDLRNWILEHRGTDPLHPHFGSILDGGMSRGIRTDSFIGSSITQEVLLDIESEIRRIIAAYQSQQSDRLRRDLIRFGNRHTFSNDEILDSVGDIVVKQIGDVVAVRVSIITGSGRSLNITQPLANA